MNKLKAIVTLIRLPNLIFIVLTQILTYYKIILIPVLKTSQATLSLFHFILLCFTTVLIAAAGYIINDYFDIGIDVINKPQKVTIEKIFKRRSVIISHILLNIIALGIIGYISIINLQLRYTLWQFISINLLLFYSISFKRKFLIGNVVIAILTSLTLFITAIYEPKFQIFQLNFPHTKLLWMYIIFAFVITFIREIVKDIEDVKGDSFQKCETMPLVWGIQKAKYVLYGLLFLLCLLILTTSFYFFSFNTLLSFYMGIFVFLPTVSLFYFLSKATKSLEFHKMSTYVKIITLLGILSIIFI